MAELGETLSDRELDVLRCVAKGASNREIAVDLVISHNTVKVHLRNIFTKLGVSSRTEAIAVALERGLVPVPGEGMAAAVPSFPAPDPAASPLAEVEGAGESLPPGETITAPTPRRLKWRTVAVILALLAVVVSLVGLFSLRALDERPNPTSDPFVEEPLGENWLLSRPMPAGRAGMAMAVVGLDVYQVGGETVEGVVNNVTVYDTDQYQWQEVAAKPTAVKEATAAVLFGEVYVPGGRTANGQPTSVVEAYSPANRAWRPVASLPQPVAGGLALSNGSFLYLFGGWNGEEYLNTAYVYDPVGDSWRPLPPLQQGRAFAAGGAVTGHLYVVGGFDGLSELATCQFLDPVAIQWSDCPDMLLSRAGAGAAVLLNKLYVIGGGMGAGSDVKYSEFYDPNTQTWHVINTPMLGSGAAWTHLGVANVETRIYVLGGRRGDELLADNFVYTPFIYTTFIPAASAGAGNE